ncbi:MAG TPA: hypothetical protein VF828_00800 [Patescibacteria group bacterium]
MNQIAGLVIAYSANEKGELDNRSLMQLIAARDLRERGIIDKIVITTGSGEALGSNLASIMFYKSLSLGIKQEDIILLAKAGSCYQEIGYFELIAKKYKWTNLIIIGSQPNLPRIQYISKMIFHRSKNITVRTLSSEEILLKSPRFADYIRLVKDNILSKESTSLRVQEFILMFLYSMPFGLELMELLGKYINNNKIQKTFSHVLSFTFSK